MITVVYEKLKRKFVASFEDSQGYKVKFGPYPSKKRMNESIKEYMELSNVNMYSVRSGFITGMIFYDEDGVGTFVKVKDL